MTVANKEGKMIVVEVRFWTDDIPKKGALSPKTRLDERDG